MFIAPISTLIALTTFLFVASLAGTTSADTSPWPVTAARSDAVLTPVRELAVSVNFGGAYIPQVADISTDNTAIVEGTLIWNLTIFDKFALFGFHTLTKMWWGDSALLTLGNELGLRYAMIKHVTVETAYLNHRLDRAWAGKLETRPGGVVDYGVELGAWFHFQPIKRLKIGLHAIGRVFEVYMDTHRVAGFGIRVSLLPFDGHKMELDLTLLRVERGAPRTGVEKVTWNTVASIKWRSRITRQFGVALGGTISTNLQVGIVPMLELKRSMINEPMALATIGVFFGI